MGTFRGCMCFHVEKDRGESKRTQEPLQMEQLFPMEILAVDDASGTN